MASVNKVIVLGNVGQDPEVRYMPNGDAAVNVSLATTRKWKNKDTNETNEETEWHRVAFFGRQAEVVGEYVKKGDPLYVEGRLKTRKWTDKEGVEKYTTEIIGDSLQLLGGRRDGGGQGDAPRGNSPQDRGAAPARGREQSPSQGSRSAPPAQRGSSQQRQASPRNQSGGFDNMDDDIPF